MTPRLPPAVAWAALVVYVVATAVIAAHHEPWRDEADAWLVARDADAKTFVRRAALAGTPTLWYAMLVPLARGGAPYDAQKVLHLAIAVASVALILFRSPFPWLTKLAAAFSYYFAYEYAVVVRNYALSVLLLLLIALWYATRFVRPYRYALLVALLANTNTHGLFIAALLGLFFIYESRRWKPAAVMLLGGLVCVAQLAAAPGEGATSFIRFQPGAFAVALGHAFLPTLGFAAAPLLGAAIVACATVWLWRRRVLLGLLWASYAVLACIFTFVWLGGPRHTGLLLVLLLVVTWIALDEAQGPARARTACLVLLTLSLLVADIITIGVFRADYRYAYSGAKEIADFLKTHGLAKNTIAAHSETTTSAVAPYLDHPLWYAGIEEPGTFAMWDKKFDAGLDVPYPEAVRRIRRHFGHDPGVLVLLNVDVPSPLGEGLVPLCADRIPIFGHDDERFFLYRLR